MLRLEIKREDGTVILSSGMLRPPNGGVTIRLFPGRELVDDEGHKVSGVTVALVIDGSYPRCEACGEPFPSFVEEVKTGA